MHGSAARPAATCSRILDSEVASALAAVMTGLSRGGARVRGALREAIDDAFGQAIAQKQAIAFKLADIHIETEAHALARVEGGEPVLEQGLPTRRATCHHRPDAYAAEQSVWIADEGLQVLGGHGFIREHPVEMWYRNARTLSVLEGTLAL